MAAGMVDSQTSSKRILYNLPDSDLPQKNRKVLFNDGDSPDESDISSQLGGVTVKANGSSFRENEFQVNEDYARRFEYNKKREELRRRKTKIPLFDFQRLNTISAG